jgi:hypothetical protein
MCASPDHLRGGSRPRCLVCSCDVSLVSGECQVNSHLPGETRNITRPGERPGGPGARPGTSPPADRPGSPSRPSRARPGMTEPRPGEATKQAPAGALKRLNSPTHAGIPGRRRPGTAAAPTRHHEPGPPGRIVRMIPGKATRPGRRCPPGQWPPLRGAPRRDLPG